MMDASLIEAISHPRFNPPAIVEELRAAPFAIITEEFARELEAEFEQTVAKQDAFTEGLSALMAEESFKDDGEEFREIIRNWDAKAEEVAVKLILLEKALRRAQRANPRRDRMLDERLLDVARRDYEHRIDASMFWRAQQARIWPTIVSDTFDDADSLGKALRAAIA